MDPRDHHFQFKYALLSFVMKDTKPILSAAADPNGVSFLKMLWEEVGKQLPEADRHEANGLNIQVWTPDQPKFAVITFPETVGMGEPIYMAVLPNQDPNKGIAALVLERSFNMETKEPMTMLIGMSAQNRSSFGPFLPNPTVEAFCQHIVDSFASPESKQKKKPSWFTRIKMMFQ